MVRLTGGQSTRRAGRLPARLHGAVRVSEAWQLPWLDVEADQLTEEYDKEDRARDVRAAGQGVLSRGRRRQPVRLVDLPPDERAPVLREYPVQVPHGVAMMLKTGVIEDPGPDGFAAAAPRLAVFRIEPLSR